MSRAYLKTPFEIGSSGSESCHRKLYNRRAGALSFARACCLVAALITACAAPRNKVMEMKLSPVTPLIPQETAGTNGDSTLTAIRLVGSKAPHLIASRLGKEGFALTLASIQEGSASGYLKTSEALPPGDLPPVSALPGPPPAWDAAQHADGSISMVWTQAGSAVVQLAIRNSLDSEEGMVNEQTPFGVFGAPHFSRPDGESRDPIASIALLDGDPQVVIFRRNSDGSFAKYQAMDTNWRGLPLDAKLVRCQAGFILIVKVKAEIDGSLEAGRMAGNGSILSLGYLDAFRMDGNFQTWVAMDLDLEKEPVFEFDALATDSSLIVLATTQGGGILGIRRIEKASTDKEFKQEVPAVEFASADPLTSPSLWVSGKIVTVAAIQNVRSPESKIVGSQMELH